MSWSGPAPTGTPETIEPGNRLHLRRRLLTRPYRLYPIADQIVDKVCAAKSTDYPGGQRSSRVKDVVDVVVLVHTRVIQLDELRAAIPAERQLSRIKPLHRFDTPPAGVQTCATTARGVVVAESLTAEATADASLIEPALDTDSVASQRNLETLTWSPTEDDA